MYSKEEAAFEHYFGPYMYGKEDDEDEEECDDYEEEENSAHRTDSNFGYGYCRCSDILKCRKCQHLECYLNKLEELKRKETDEERKEREERFRQADLEDKIAREQFFDALKMVAGATIIGPTLVVSELAKSGYNAAKRGIGNLIWEIKTRI